MEPIIFHIDVNSAFLSWTAVDRLRNGDSVDLREIPSIIGGDMKNRHGIVLAKSIPAKKYGITTGEPIVNAFRKCPSLLLVSPDRELYSKRSHELMQFLSSVCPDIEQVSIDECYMNYAPIIGRFDSYMEGAAFIKNTISEKFEFTVNIGISDRKVLAKMASDFEKPNRIHTLFHSQIKEKMWPLPVSSLFMCGKSSIEALKNLGILTIGDLALTSPEIIQAHLKSHGLLLWEYANGIDDSKVVLTPAKRVGVGNSTTLSKDAVTADECFKVLLTLSESVSARLRKSGQAASMISVEIKYADFQTVSHQTIIPAPADTANRIYETAGKLFLECWNHSPVRLLGIRTSHLTKKDEPVQLSLFDLFPDTPVSNVKQQKLENAIDSIRHKFGKDAIVRGSLLHKQEPFDKS